MVDELQAQVIPGLNLENDAFVGCSGSRISRALVVDGDGGLAHFIDPSRWAEIAKVSFIGSRNQKQIEYAICAGKAGRVEGGLGGTGES